MILNLSGKDCKELQSLYDGIDSARKFERDNEQKLKSERAQVELGHRELFRKLTSMRATEQLSAAYLDYPKNL